MREKLPNELYTVADSEYTLGTVDFLVNELGLTHKKSFLVDEPTTESGRKNLISISEEYVPDLKENIFIETDGGKISKELYETLGRNLLPNVLIITMFCSRCLFQTI